MRSRRGAVLRSDEACEHYFGEARRRGTSHTVFKAPWPGDPRVNILQQSTSRTSLTTVRRCGQPRSLPGAYRKPRYGQSRKSIRNSAWSRRECHRAGVKYSMRQRGPGARARRRSAVSRLTPNTSASAT